MIKNIEVSKIFDEVADLLEIQGENPFRIRAYRNAARVIQNWPKNLAEVLKTEGSLPKIPGVGHDLDAKIREIITTGSLKLWRELQKKTPQPLLELLEVPTLGPKRVKALQERLQITSVQDLATAARFGKIQKLPGFGQKTESRILKELEQRPKQKRFLWIWAEQLAGPLLKKLRSFPGVKEISAAGSLRRHLETVGDLDLLATVLEGRAPEVMDRFVGMEEVSQVISHGRTRSTVILTAGIQVDLRLVPEESYGAALHYFTGSKTHNIAIRTLGLRQGLKINEYGIFKGHRRIGGRSEEEVYRSVGLPWIEPELREDRGEIEAAQRGKLPSLITLKDIRGDLHSHTRATDGRLGLREMAEAAQRRGYDYLAITDHTQHLSVAKGLNPQRLLEQIREIDQLNEEWDRGRKKFRILKGSEVDILEDGRLDLPQNILQKLDLRVCSIHSHFELSQSKQTERIIRAMDHPCFNIFGHPTGRLIGKRSAYTLDLERVMKAAVERGRILELNCQPDRMDLSDVHCQMAREFGVKLAISTDAHSDQDLDHMRLGVFQARRGWITSQQVVNTRSLEEVLASFKEYSKR